MLNRFLIFFSVISDWTDLPTTMIWTDLTFSWIYSTLRVKKDCWIWQYSFETGDFFLKIHNVLLVGLEENVMDHRLWVNDATTEFIHFLYKYPTVLDWPRLSELIVLILWTYFYCKGKNRWLDLTMFLKNVDFLPKIYNVPSLGLKGVWTTEFWSIMRN